MGRWGVEDGGKAGEGNGREENREGEKGATPGILA